MKSEKDDASEIVSMIQTPSASAYKIIVLNSKCQLYIPLTISEKDKTQRGQITQTEDETPRLLELDSSDLDGSLSIERMSEASNGIKIFGCPASSCAATFSSQHSLNEHMSSHGTKSYRCPHPGCDRLFKHRCNVSSHARVHTVNSDSLQCDFPGCGRRFEHQCRLKQHQRSHTGERPFACSVDGCCWAFATSSKLTRHLRQHTGQRQWKCPYKGCGKMFFRLEHVRGHLRTHSDDRPYLCSFEGCDARFKGKSTLFAHIRKHEHKSLVHSLSEGSPSSSIAVSVIKSYTKAVDGTLQLNRLKLHGTGRIHPSSKSAEQLGAARTSFQTSRLVDLRASKSRVQSQPEMSQLQANICQDSFNLVTSPPDTCDDDTSFHDIHNDSIYLQTQLLQDDSLTSDVYIDKSIISVGGEDNIAGCCLNGDDDNLNYTGTTINLQDLE